MEETGPLGPPALNKRAVAKQAAVGSTGSQTEKDLADILATPEPGERVVVRTANAMSTAEEPSTVESVEESTHELVKKLESAPALPTKQATSQPDAAEIIEEETIEEPDALNDYWHDPGDPDGVIAKEQQELEEQRRKNRAAVAAHNKQPEQRYRTSHSKLWAIPAIVVFLAIPVGAYMYTARKQSTPVIKTTTAAGKQAGQSTTATSATPSTKTSAVPTKNYTSTTYTLGFDYPETWTVSDTAAKLTVTSPSVSLVTSAGTKTTGHVQLTIQNQQTTIAGYPADGAVATLASQKLTYKQPTTVQRAQTYLSFLGYKAAAIDGLYVTGDDGYQAQQAVAMSDIVQHNPLISVTFATCASDDCSSGAITPISLQANSWQSASFSTQIINLLQSLQLD